jgi:HK97 family phage major capsid protein
MSTALIERLNEERAGLVAFVEQTIANVEGRDLSDTETRTINDSKARIDAIDAQLKPLADFMESRAAAADLSRTLGGASKREQSRVESRSIGELFAASDAFAQYRGMGTSARFVTEARALPIGTGDVASNKVVPRVDATLPTSTPLLDAIPTINVSANGIEVVVWAKKSGGAAVVAEKSAKPAVEYGPTVTPKTLQTIAGYTQMTRQLMEDEPAVASTINSLLMRDVVLKA